MRWLALVIAISPVAAGAATPGEIGAALITPALERFATEAAALDKAADADCTAEALRPAYDAAFDAWLGVAVYRIGPTEVDALSIAFWPDEKGLTPKGLRALLAAKDEAALTPDGFAEGSAAVRGFFALDQMLGDAELSGYGAEDVACRVVQAIAGDLSRSASALKSDWDGFMPKLATAGEAGNTTYLSSEEATRALYTQLLSGIEFAADQRLGRPLGTFDKPRPTRAEAWRTGRPLRNVAVSLDALQPLAHELAGAETPATDAAFAAVRTAMAAVADPTLQDLGDPQAWLKAEIVQSRLRSLYDAVETEVGGRLGLEAGFNSLDGD